MAKNSETYTVSVSPIGAVIERTGEVVSRSADGITFRFKKPRSSKMVTTFFPNESLVALVKGKRGDDVLYVAAPVGDPLFKVEGPISVSKGEMEIETDAGKATVWTARASVRTEAEGDKPAASAAVKKKKKAKK